MKTIDRTPYLTKNGEISFLNRLRAEMKFGSSWYPEIKAQQVVMDILNRDLSKGYTLLRNIALPGSEAIIPLILLGPAGAFVIYVTTLKGNYQAKGDNWGSLEHKKVRAASPNLMVLTSRMARGVQHYLGKQGIELSNVDGILIATDPGMHIESVRPLVRVVLSDAIELFARSLNNSFSVLESGMSQIIINRLTEPGADVHQVPSDTPQASPQVQADQAAEATPGVPEIGDVLPWAVSNPDVIEEKEPANITGEPADPYLELEKDLTPKDKKVMKGSTLFQFNTRQWLLLISFGIVEIIILLVFFWIISFTL
jgi:hypothetical protein